MICSWLYNILPVEQNLYVTYSSWDVYFCVRRIQNNLLGAHLPRCLFNVHTPRQTLTFRSVQFKYIAQTLKPWGCHNICLGTALLIVGSARTLSMAALNNWIDKLMKYQNINIILWYCYNIEFALIHTNYYLVFRWSRLSMLALIVDEYHSCNIITILHPIFLGRHPGVHWFRQCQVPSVSASMLSIVIILATLSFKSFQQSPAVCACEHWACKSW